MKSDYKAPILLRFVWTISRAADTYGYNICSLYAAGTKVESCRGGGYDMKGTLLAEYLEHNFQEKLLRIKDQSNRIHTQDAEMKWHEATNDKGLYGMTLLTPHRTPENVSINGSCGINCVEKIAKAAGIELVPTRVGKDEYGYFLHS